MKKSLILLLTALLILPIISAIQIDMKSDFAKDETLLAQVSGNFLEKIQEQNVLLYKEYVRVSFISYVEKIGDKFYIYGQLLGKSSGNYSLVISGVDYFESGETKDDDVSKNFTIAETKADFSITPGFLQTTGDFSINAQSFVDTTLTITSFIQNSPKNTETQISPGQTKSISFSINNSYKNQLIYSVLESGNTHYEVPVFVSGNATQGSSTPVFGFQPSQRNVSIATNSSTFIYLYLYNSGENDLENVSLSADDIIKPYVSIPDYVSADANSSTQIRINISSGNLDGFFEGIITAAFENLTSDFILTLNFSKFYIPSNDSSLFQTCAELGGSFCNENQTCRTDDVRGAVDGACCIGGCKPISTNSGKILGWMLVAVVLLVIVFFVWRYIKAKKPFNLLDFARKK